MFLILKNNNELFLALEGSDAIISVMYASLREEYKDIELDVVFDKPSCNIERNLVKFINILNGDSISKTGKENYDRIKEVSIDRTAVVNKANSIDTNNVNIDLKENVEKIEIEIEEIKPRAIESIEIEEVEPIKTNKESIIEIEEVEPVVVKRVDPAERTLEKIREQQRQEGLPKLDNKVNTLEYRKYLENFMKLGFTASVLSKKVSDMSDRELKSKMNNICEEAMNRVEKYEEKFKAAGLTTAQIHTFRMEALREVKKYRDSSYEEVYKYLRKLFDLSEELINELK